MRRLLLALGPLVVLLACGSETPSTGTDPGADASTDGGGGGRTDGSLPPVDGAVPGDAASGPFCASLVPAPKLCEDFDDGTPPAKSDTDIGPGASCAIDQGAAASSPSSYLCTIPAGVSFVTNALLRTPLPFDASAKTFVVSFAFRPDAAAPASGTLVIARAFLGQTHAVSIELTSENGPVLREQAGGPPPTLDVPSANLTAMPAAGQWTRYELTLDLVGKTATLKADGAQVASMNLTGAGYDLFALNLGLQSDSPFAARFDNVVMDWSP
jgi:hypothetical protein